MISQTVLIVSLPFARALDGGAVARAIARGLIAEGWSAPDPCPLDAAEPRARRRAGSAPYRRGDARDMASLLEELDFDARMRRSRAVILAQRFLEDRTLRGSVAFEVATRARQGGVPAYAVVEERRLTAFDARVMDLQQIFEASSARALAGAGRKLAAIV